MFLGHFGLGFGAKRLAPAVSLGTLFLGAQFVDLLWPTLLLLGWETVSVDPGNTVVTPLSFSHYPISHSLLMAVVWGLVLGAVYYALRKDRRGAVVVGGLVASHWVLDLLVHRPDLPVTMANEPLLGLGLWNNLGATLAVEALVFGLGVWMYVRSTAARDRTGTIALWSLIGFFVLIYAANLLGDPPPNSEAIAWVGQAQWLLVAWGYWVDRHRETQRPR